MKHNNVYTVEYRLYAGADSQIIDVIAPNKAEAWDKANYEAIPKREGECPYSAWVKSVTYNNGNYHRFNTSEGNPF